LTTVLSDHGFNSGKFKLILTADFVGKISKVIIKKVKETSLGVKSIEIK